MKIKQNAFGDYLVNEGCINKGYTLKIMGMHKVCNSKGVLMGYILKRENIYISYDSMGNAHERGDFEKLLIGFFKQKKG